MDHLKKEEEVLDEDVLKKKPLKKRPFVIKDSAVEL